jgi:adenine-specific DNA-methyltransferase
MHMPTLSWIGKDKVVNHHKEVPFRILEPQYTFTNGEVTNSGSSENKIIHGDNLEALKALLPEYEGKVNCIYIDPPYNTGNEGWVYNDNVNHPKIKKWLGEVVGKEGEDLSRHDKWLCMMYPRLKLLHKLLHEEGAIFISIDDKEHSNLKLVCDEIFGLRNFIINVVWQKRYSRENRGTITDAHEFVLVYAKNTDLFKNVVNKIAPTEDQVKVYKNPNNDPKGRWRPIPMTAQGFRPNQMYPIIAPKGKIHYPPEGRCWSTVEPEYLKLKSQGKIYFGKDDNSQPNIIRYLNEIEGFTPWSWWSSTEVGHTDEAKKEIHSFFGKINAFDTPKPVRLINRIIEIATSKNSIILDSFAGSGTTAHAVVNLNKVDGGNRKFILVEMEDYANSLTAERVKKVMNDSGEFTYYNLGDTLFNSDNELNEEVPLQRIREYIYYTETGEFLKHTSISDCHYLDTHNGISYYFYYNKNEMTTLDLDLLGTITTKSDQYVIYADNCLLSPEFMAKHNIIFKKIPRDITRF